MKTQAKIRAMFRDLGKLQARRESCSDTVERSRLYIKIKRLKADIEKEMGVQFF